MSNPEETNHPDQPTELNDSELEQVAGGELLSGVTTGTGAGTQDAMKRVLFGAAGVTGGLAAPTDTRDPD